MSAGTVPTTRSSRRSSAPRPAEVTKKNRAAYTLLFPSILLMGVLLGYPMYRLVDISLQEFTRRQLFTRTTVYNGIENYSRLLTDDNFITITIRTLIVVVAMVVGTMVLGTLIALMLEKLHPFMRSLVSIGLLFAWATPSVSATQVWKWMFNSQYGIITWLLELVGISLRGDDSILLSGTKVLTAVVIIVIWQGIPFVTLTLYAGLTQVPKELYEAAEMDGAGFWTRFGRVTYPMLKPIFLLLITLSIIWDFRAFNQVWVFNQGGPNQESLLLGSYSYYASFVQYDFGYGAAIAIVMVVGLFALTYVYIRQMVRAGEAS
jgi:N,N'-diacetylchitobiose transport system permease protein